MYRTLVAYLTTAHADCPLSLPAGNGGRTPIRRHRARPSAPSPTSRNSPVSSNAGPTKRSVVATSSNERVPTSPNRANSLNRPPAPAAAPAAVAKEAAAGKNESVTNVQHAGVDEGGIVKLHGDHLVILRRGRLFTVRIGARSCGRWPWSMPSAATSTRRRLVRRNADSGNTIVVIGYSYARGGTEIGVFDISRAGQLAYRATYHLRSNDYYSSRNYASRLIGSKLIVYSPHVPQSMGRSLGSLPGDAPLAPGGVCRPTSGASRRRRGSTAATSRSIPSPALALHSVSICDLARPEMDCQSTAVLGPPGRVFYVSPDSVFVWTTAQRSGARLRRCSASRSTDRHRVR
jgi:hypothetical protein